MIWYPLDRSASRRCSISLALLAAGLFAGTAQGWEPSLLATGGVARIYTNNFVIYGCHSFTTVGSTNFTPLVDNLTVQYLVIGGGGGGGVDWDYGGGGGAGGYRCSVPGESSGSNTTAEAATNLTDTTPVPIVVGDGGGGGTASGSTTLTPATNGQDSSFGSIVATGGGRGGSDLGNPGTGGSGGGGHRNPLTAGAAGTAGQGREGGSGWDGHSGGGGGGGGGASAPGTAFNLSDAQSGKGGDGLYSSITGVSTPRGGGGGGVAHNGHGGAAGIGGGGAAYGNGTPGTGGGGGSSFTGTGGKGGSGVVIVRYVIPNPAPAAGNLGASDVTTSSATFNGFLVSTGSSASAVCVLWGLANKGATWAWANTNWFDDGAVNAAWTNNTPFSTNITGLAQGTYYYTFGATNAGGVSAISPPTNFITGEVTVKAAVTPDQWKETGGSVTGKFTITRPASCTNESLTVAYTLSGSVTSDTRYALSPPASATMAAGATSAVVALTPHFFLGSDRQAILTLTTGTGNYPYGSPVANAATVTVSAAIVAATPPFRAWGGNNKYVITNASGRIYAVHEYTSVDGPYFGTNYFIPSQPIRKIEYLVIGGGGGGGNYNTAPYYGGGGGAGGYRCSVPTESSGSNTTAEAVTNVTDTTPIPVVVGAGGGGGYGLGTIISAPATNGQDSLFGSIVATGGGRGGSYSWGPGTGGSGGGGQLGGPAGAGGTAGQGMAGGIGYGGPTKVGSGGGGGASAPGNGGNADGALRSKGGDGLYSSITGVSTPRGGGGAGQAADNAGGGGGVGGGGSPTGNMNGQANTGSGGGGAWNAGGNGGSGIVIVRYDISPPKGTVLILR